jgi:hypothetical protein
MPLWKTPEVAEQGSITLIRWRILEVAEGPLKGQRHLCGYCIENFEGRASTAIIEIDKQKRRCITRSGRIYRLEGPPGFDPDGAYVWDAWTRGIATIDVSEIMETPDVSA